MHFVKQSNKKEKICFVCFGIIVTILLIVIACLIYRKPKQIVTSDQFKENIELDGTQTAKTETSSSQDFIYFTGFDNVFITSGETITLPCDAANKDGNIYMSYQILKDGEIVYETGLIESGNHVVFPVSEILGIGEHTIILHEQPYQLIDPSKEISVENMTKLYFVDQTITVTVVE